MNTTTRTLVYVGSAAALAVIALVTSMSPSDQDIDGFSDVGTALFQGFEDPADAETLEVVAWDYDAETPLIFGVSKTDDDNWVITSHNDYPTEAADRLAKTATSMIGIERSAVQSRDKEDWSKFGVLDPSAEDAGEYAASEDSDKDDEGEGSEDEDEEDKPDPFGTRITLRDGSSNALVDLIVGNEVPDRDGYRYVREPDNQTTYISKMSVDLSAKFVDWIEPDLLKVQQNQIVRIKVDGYSIDETQEAIVAGDVVEFEKEDLKSAGSWQLVGLNEETEEFDNSAVSAIARNLQGLKIVGVRKKRPGINPDLTVDTKVVRSQLDMIQLQAEMQNQGFFIVPDRNSENQARLASNEGELLAGTDEGVLYTLYFGEVARGSAREIEVGLSSDDKDEAGKESDKDQDDKEPEKGDAEGESSEENASGDAEGDSDEAEEETGSRRYVLIKVEFDESLLGPKPEAPVEPVKPAILNEEPEKNPAEDKGDNKPADKDDADKSESDKEEPAKDEAAEEESGQDTAGKSDEPDDCGPQDETAAADEKPAAAEDEAKTQESASGDEEKKDAAAAEETGEKADEKPAGSDTDRKADAAEDKGDEKPAEPQKSPRELAQEEYDRAVSDYAAAKLKYESDLQSFSDKVEEGQKKVKELADRFGGWYYVITADSFEKFRIERSEVVTEKKAEEEDKDGADADTSNGN